MKNLIAIATVFSIFIASSCRYRDNAVVIAPDRTLSRIDWSDDELKREIAIRTIKTTNETSHHIIRLTGAEKPHVHDYHDLTVFVLSGKARIHFEGRVVEAAAGDVVEIPRGSYHWAENIDPVASEVYAVFNPPFDGKDRRPVTIEDRSSDDP